MNLPFSAQQQSDKNDKNDVSCLGLLLIVDEGHFLVEESYPKIFTIAPEIENHLIK